MPQDEKPILIIEDSAVQSRLFSESLLKEGYTVVVRNSGESALAVFDATLPAAIVLDLELPDMHGFDILDHVHADHPDIPVIIATSSTSIDRAIEAMKKGAFDFLVKPFPMTQLAVTLRNALSHRALAHEVRAFRRTLTLDAFHGMVGQSSVMQAVYRTIESVADSRTNVFIIGEHGIGKKLAARAVHNASQRRSKPYIAVNCATIPADMLDSYLFGHRRDAFAGAVSDQGGAIKEAHRGTLFLDEIGAIPLAVQTKLLHYLQTNEILPIGAVKPDTAEVRIVAAASHNVREEIKARRFREDLYDRLHVVPIELPPLRDRGEDIMMLSRHFLSLYATEEGKQFTGLAPEVEKIFRFHDWPGNVRQLENVLRNIVVLHDGSTITESMLPTDLQSFVGKSLNLPANENAFDLALSKEAPSSTVKPLWATERDAIQSALTFTRDDIPRAAALLEISPAALCRKMQQWDKLRPADTLEVIAV